MVKYVYTDHVDITDNNQHELLSVAHKFQLKELVQMIHLHQNMKNNPMASNELEQLRLKYEQAKYVYDEAKKQNSIRNQFSQAPSRYY
jgi:hypothetical protein